jgi:hypothetical protein
VFSLSSTGADCNRGEYAAETSGRAICVCGRCSKLNVCCARVVVHDNNAIATAQQIGWLILDIAANVFIRFLLKMIEGFSFANGRVGFCQTFVNEFILEEFSLDRACQVGRFALDWLVIIDRSKKRFHRARGANR